MSEAHTHTTPPEAAPREQSILEKLSPFLDIECLRAQVRDKLNIVFASSPDLYRELSKLPEVTSHLSMDPDGSGILVLKENVSKERLKEEVSLVLENASKSHKTAINEVINTQLAEFERVFGRFTPPPTSSAPSSGPAHAGVTWDDNIMGKGALYNPLTWPGRSVKGMTKATVATAGVWKENWRSAVAGGALGMLALPGFGLPIGVVATPYAIWAYKHLTGTAGGKDAHEHADEHAAGGHH